MHLSQTLFNKLYNIPELYTLVVKARENERIRIAEELHDNVNQMLGTARLLLNLIYSNSDQITDLLPKTIDLIDKSINEIRSLSHSAFASAASNCSAIREIAEMAETISMASGIMVTFKHDNTQACKLSDFEQLNVLRIVQEATNNILKHANATKITIDIKETDNNLEIKITDDGQGFHPQTVKKGAGLDNIRHKAGLLKARHTLQSTPGKGTVLYISIPLS